MATFYSPVQVKAGCARSVPPSPARPQPDCGSPLAAPVPTTPLSSTAGRKTCQHNRSNDSFTGCILCCSHWESFIVAGNFGKGKVGEMGYGGGEGGGKGRRGEGGGGGWKGG